ncbi:MAG: MBL fold metallo-hydrolase [Candidatus Algichlamydia australiensis]|nr:MBL fold metallo-hydrolase [Chlamydiales bacterium]
MKYLTLFLLVTGFLSSQPIPDGSATTKRNFLNDPFYPQKKIGLLNPPECWPIFYNRGPIDRSPSDKSSKLITLGTGMPAPNPYRYGPSSALIVNGFPYFVDCGEAWWRGLSKAAISQSGIDLNEVFTLQNLEYMFITHLHIDHTEGLPAFILNTYKYGPSVDKKIFGPKGIGEMVANINRAWKVDRNEMFQGAIRADPGGSIGVGVDIDPAVEFPGPVFEDKNVKVEAIRTLRAHGALEYTYAYRFTTKPDNRVIAFGGDGHYSKGLVEAARDADILVIEGCTFKNIKYLPWGNGDEEEKIFKIRSYHMFPEDLARVQKESGVKQIVLIHQQNGNVPEKYSRLQLLQEMKDAGVKNIYSAMDGDLF